MHFMVGPNRPITSRIAPLVWHVPLPPSLGDALSVTWSFSEHGPRSYIARGDVGRPLHVRGLKKIGPLP